MNGKLRSVRALSNLRLLAVEPEEKAVGPFKLEQDCSFQETLRLDSYVPGQREEPGLKVNLIHVGPNEAKSDFGDCPLVNCLCPQDP